MPDRRGFEIYGFGAFRVTTLEVESLVGIAISRNDPGTSRLGSGSIRRRLRRSRPRCARQLSPVPAHVHKIEEGDPYLLDALRTARDCVDGAPPMYRFGEPNAGRVRRILPGDVSPESVTESFPDPAALRKAQREVAEFHRFRKLGEDLVDVSEKICALRPVESSQGGWTAQEKNGCNPSGNCAAGESTAGTHFHRAP
jgi:hypothetical protein